MSQTNPNRYNGMDRVLQEILRNKCALQRTDVKENNKILHRLLDELISEMCKDPLFGKLYKTPYYGGSFFDGMKITRPDEFDIHIQMDLPDGIDARLEESNAKGYVLIKILTDSAQSMPPQFARLVRRNGYLDSAKVRAWMESVTAKALQALETRNFKSIRINRSKSGPAQTLLVVARNRNINVDLVPCFKFDKYHWPRGGFRPNVASDEKPDFHVVPKSPKNMKYVDHYWILNMFQQEQVIIRNKPTFKPVVKLMKALRDVYNDRAIASYYIKNMALEMIDEHSHDRMFWKRPLSFVFMTLLKKYLECLKRPGIKYYWHSKCNMIKFVKPDLLKNIENRTASMIADIERNLDTDPRIIAKYFGCYFYE